MAPTSILDLPNELILQTLSSFQTTELLTITTLSHRFHALIIRLLQTRLFQAANLPDHTLLLECYHPSQKLTEPPLYCTYLGTPGLDTCVEDDNEDHYNPIGRISTLRNLYSSFIPYRRQIKPYAKQYRHPAGDIPGSRTHPSSSSAVKEEEQDAVRQILSLEGHELFTQLCAVTNIVRVGPRNGLFRSFVEVQEGVVRVWREWLARRASMDAGGTESTIEISALNLDKPNGKNVIRENDVDGTGIIDICNDDRILWIDMPKNVGLRVDVSEKKWRRNMPVLMHADEEVSVSYEVVYQGTRYDRELQDISNINGHPELLVRTSHLLLMLEKSALQQENHSGKAVVFGSFG